MEKEKLRLCTLKSQYPRLMSLILAMAMTFIFGLSQSHAVEKPILTKSGRLAAIKKAAAAIQDHAKSASLLALPNSATDPAVIPHYFGPFPNWANSPFTLPDATVTINANGPGAGATASAIIGKDGAVTGVTITNPGSGYTNAATVLITGAGIGAAADAVVDVSGGSVTAVNVSVSVLAIPHPLLVSLAAMLLLLLLPQPMAA